MVNISKKYTTLENYDLHSHNEILKESYTHEDDEIFINPYDDNNPYLYQFTPYYSEFPYGTDYHLVDDDDQDKKYLDIFPSYISTELNTRITYNT